MNFTWGEIFFNVFFSLCIVFSNRLLFFTGTGRLIPRGNDYISIRWSGLLRYLLSKIKNILMIVIVIEFL